MLTTTEIPKHRLSSYLDDVTREMEDMPLSIEPVRDREPAQLPADHVVVQFLAYDDRDGLFEVAGTTGNDGRRTVIQLDRSG